jgi:hypothetical protein
MLRRFVPQGDNTNIILNLSSVVILGEVLRRPASGGTQDERKDLVETKADNLVKSSSLSP